MQLTAVYLKVPEGYIGFVEELPGANTQGETIEEARINCTGSCSNGSGSKSTISRRNTRGQEFIREQLPLAA